MAARRTARRRHNPAPNSFLRVLGPHIRALREARHLSQAAVGGQYLTRSMVSRIESGRYSPSLRSLSYIADRLNVSLRALIPDDL